ncbi:right-handed parallel beta-helix repeat-containing protein [Dokdonella soli]
MLGLLLVALWTIQPAHANTVTCVASSASLNLALANVEVASGTTYIELVQGTYDVSSTLLTNTTVSYNSLQLLGGYTDSNCSARVVNGENTVIDGANLYTAMIAMNAGATLVVEGLRFQNFPGSGSGVQIGNRGYTEIRFNHFYKTGLTISDQPTPGYQRVSVDNNLVDESLPGQDGLHIGANNSDTVTLTGNTIGYAANRSLYLCMNSNIAKLANNIVWGSYGGTDIRIGCDIGGSMLATFDDNTYGTLDGAEASGSSGTLKSNPLFIGSGNYRLQTAPTISPSINSGDNSAPNITGTDLDGNPRVVGSAVDRGAYESSYDDTTGNTIVVTNANDSGPGSLRDAITQANAVNVFHYINFNIPGSCPQFINLASALPTIKYGMRIDGYSQPGTHANTAAINDNAVRCVVLDGGGTISVGLNPVFSNANSQFWVQGLIFAGFHDTGGNCGGSALSLNFAGSGALVWGNQFGGQTTANNFQVNDIDIVGGTNASIGGSAPAQRNIITGAVCTPSSSTGHNGFGITAPYGFFSNATGMSIVGNIIGAIADETAPFGRDVNDIDIYLETSGNTISNNVIVDALSGSGVYLNGAQATGNTIDHNLIGVTESSCVTYPFPLCFGGTAAPNSNGIYLQGPASGNTIASNTIWNNAFAGIRMASSSSVASYPQRNTISGNSFHNNAPNNNMGYSMYGNPEYIQNDADANVQATSNRGLNHPVITSAIGGTTSGVVTGTLQSTNAIYNIEVFSSLQNDSNGYGEGQGQVFHTAQGTSITNSPSGNNGSVSFSIPFNVEPGGSLAGRLISLTATDAAGNTSQFSGYMPYTCDVIFKYGFDSATAEKCP